MTELTKFFLSRQLNLQGGNKPKWDTLCHNGVIFAPEYIQHNIPIIYKNQKIQLNKEAEELATLYAKYLDTEYIKNPTFNKNFWKDWKKTVDNIDNLESCDFTLIKNYLISQKENQTKEEKQERKLQREKEEEIYKTALLNGVPQPVGNFRMEPPGIFLGRGCHPKLGRVKKRVLPQDITLNIGKDCPIPNHNWGKIIHDRHVEWLASWKDNITGKIKYVWLGNKSKFKADSDIKKFDLARKLKKKIKKIRKNNNENLGSTNHVIKQVATALYFVDYLALRVGNEKGEDQADTVGVTSLRVEHVKLLEDNNISLDFLGKDSIRYKKTFQVDNQVYKNLEEFIKDKSPGDDIFDKINSNDVNKYLQSFMKDLTAKVFRTYNASVLFQKELKKLSNKYDSFEEANKIDLLLDGFNKANIKVALLCNHQKKVSKNFDDQLEKIKLKIKEEQKKLKKASKKEKIKERIKKLKAKRDLKIELKSLSLDTSKTNYIDPRITIAFMKKHLLPVDKIFSKNLQEKFSWAMEVSEGWKF